MDRNKYGVFTRALPPAFFTWKLKMLLHSADAIQREREISYK